MRENPQYRDGKPCAYVGMTGLSPEERFERHKKGKQANPYVRQYGLYLMRRQYEQYNPMNYPEGQRMEVELAKKLRRKGYAVWQR